MKKVLLFGLVTFAGTAFSMDIDGRGRAVTLLPDFVSKCNWHEVVSYVAQGHLVYDDFNCYGSSQLNEKDTKSPTKGTLFQELLGRIYIGFDEEFYHEERDVCEERMKSFLKLLARNKKITHDEALIQNIKVFKHDETFSFEIVSSPVAPQSRYQKGLLEAYQTIITTATTSDPIFPFTYNGVTITQEDYEAYGNGILTEQRFNQLYPVICKIFPKMAGIDFKTYCHVRHGHINKTSYKSLAADMRAAIENHKNGVPTSSVSPSVPSSAMTVAAISKKAVAITLACIGTGAICYWYLKNMFHAKYAKNVIINETGSEIIISDTYGNDVTIASEANNVVPLPKLRGVIVVKFHDAKSKRLGRLEIDLSPYEEAIDTFFINIIIRPTSQLESYFAKSPLSYSVRWAPNHTDE